MIQVVGAGLPRTGTLSLKKALEMLLHGKTYHMFELANNPDVNGASALWLQAAYDDDALKQAVEGYVATLDVPCCMYYERLAKLHPNAKVLLSVRDEPLDWAKSIAAIKGYNIWYGSWSFLLFILTSPRHWRWAYLMQTGAVFGRLGDLNDQQHLCHFYTEHNKQVVATIPADRLLVFNVKQGWEPLCAFLGLPVPDCPFPSTNDSQMRKERYVIHERAGRRKALMVLGFASLVFLGVRAIRR